MRLLLDTHIWLWLRQEPSRLPSPVRRRIAAASSSLYLSAATVMEIAIKSAVGMLRLKVTPSDFVASIIAQGVVPVAIDIEHAIVAGALPLHHRDPFDRTLIAQAQVDELTLVTADPRILKYDVPTIDARK